MEARISRIRAEEKKYHEACYENHKLFEEGSWLHKPVQSVMGAMAQFDDYAEVKVLDLGSGVGRNSIPLAERLRARSGKVVCVDILPDALERLLAYSREHGVSEYIETHLSDIGSFQIDEQSFDLVVAVSSLEHVESEDELARVLERIKRGVREHGIVCIIMNSNLRETDLLTGEELEPLMEINLPTDQAMRVLSERFAGWQLMAETVKPLAFSIERGQRSIVLASDCITYVVRNSTAQG